MIPHSIPGKHVLHVLITHIEQSQVSPTPIVKHFIHKLHDCRIWIKMDLRQGYHQRALPASRSVPSQDLLQRIFGDIPQCLKPRNEVGLVHGTGANTMLHSRLFCRELGITQLHLTNPSVSLGRLAELDDTFSTRTETYIRQSERHSGMYCSNIKVKGTKLS